MGLFKTDQRDELLSLDTALNERILQGDALGAFEDFYADEVVMQENDEEPTVGKTANRQRENEVFEALVEFRGASVLSQAAGENVTFSHWSMDYTHRDWGVRNYRQVAVRTWKNGKIIKEVFHYA